MSKALNGTFSQMSIDIYSTDFDDISGLTSVTNDKNTVLTPKLEIMMKLEAKRKEDEDQFTYKPKINSTSLEIVERNKSEKSAGVDRFEALFQDAKKRKEQQAQLLSAVDSTLTFKPNLVTSTPISKTSVDDTTEQAPRSPKVNVNEVVERLYKPEVIKKASRSSTPVEETFTFNPKISKHAIAMERQNVTDIGDRLYGQSKTLKEKLERLKESEDQKEAVELTFAPRITSKSRSLSISRLSKKDIPADISERLMKYEASKTKKLEAAIEEKNRRELKEATFKPEINESSKRFATPTRSGDLFERLSKPVDKDGLAAKQIAELEGSFYSPQLTAKRSGSVCSASLNGDNVHDRLFKDAETQRQKLEKERESRDAIELAEATFSPKISQRAEDLPTEKPVFERLNANKQYVQEILSQMKADMEWAECTFKPLIMPRPGEDPSQPAARPSPVGPVHNRLIAEGERRKQELKKREEDKIAEEIKALTFKPELATTDYHMAKRDKSAPIYERLNSEGLKIKEVRKKITEDVLKEEEKELTFAPTIPKKSKAIANKVVTSESSQPTKNYLSMTVNATNSMSKGKVETATVKPRSSSVNLSRTSTPRKSNAFANFKNVSSPEKESKEEEGPLLNFANIYKTSKAKVKKTENEVNDSSFTSDPAEQAKAKEPKIERSRSTGQFTKPTLSSLLNMKERPTSTSDNDKKVVMRGPSPVAVKKPVVKTVKPSVIQSEGTVSEEVPETRDVISPPSAELGGEKIPPSDSLPNSTASKEKAPITVDTESPSSALPKRRAPSPKIALVSKRSQSPNSMAAIMKSVPPPKKPSGKIESTHEVPAASTASIGGSHSADIAQTTEKISPKPTVKMVSVSKPLPSPSTNRPSSTPKQSPSSASARPSAEELFRRASLVSVPAPVKPSIPKTTSLQAKPSVSSTKAHPSPSAASAKAVISPPSSRPLFPSKSVPEGPVVKVVPRRKSVASPEASITPQESIAANLSPTATLSSALTLEKISDDETGNVSPRGGPSPVNLVTSEDNESPPLTVAKRSAREPSSILSLSSKPTLDLRAVLEGVRKTLGSKPSAASLSDECNSASPIDNKLSEFDPIESPRAPFVAPMKVNVIPSDSTSSKANDGVVQKEAPDVEGVGTVDLNQLSTDFEDLEVALALNTSNEISTVIKSEIPEEVEDAETESFVLRDMNNSSPFTSSIGLVPVSANSVPQFSEELETSSALSEPRAHSSAPTDSPKSLTGLSSGSSQADAAIASTGSSMSRSASRKTNSLVLSSKDGAPAVKTLRGGNKKKSSSSSLVDDSESSVTR